MRLAHISDLHLLEPDARREKRSVHQRIRLSYLSLMRPLDAAARFERARRALLAAREGGFDHLVLSGDLTEDGEPGQFAELARVLAESGVAPDKVTLVPGNHDAYCDFDGWSRALEGPLAPYAATSSGPPGRVIDLGEAVILPISTAVHQHWASSWGSIEGPEWDALERRTGDPGLLKRALLLVQHHAPLPHVFAPLQWVDGLRGYGRQLALLARRRTLQVLHGHLHRAITRVLELGGITRVFGATAVVEDSKPRVRFYKTAGGIIVPA
jgi:3',5'-cyclic-AMP phosphodiesterase